MSEFASTQPPVLSTSDRHILENVADLSSETPSASAIADEQLYVTYEIERTVRAIRQNQWRRIALQFPDAMLVDAPRVFERLQYRLRQERQRPGPHDLTTKIEALNLAQSEDEEDRLTILGDTSYGACCVDEIAAEHVNAHVVVHYGRSCLSPTARLPVVHVFTERALDHVQSIKVFKETYPDTSTKVILMADVPYQHHVHPLYTILRQSGYSNLEPSSVVCDPSSPLPNRTLSDAISQTDASVWSEYSLFHISDPPTSLLLNVSSRFASVFICRVQDGTPSAAQQASHATAQMLRRRYAHVTRLSTASIFGILINTLSVKNYMSALTQIKDAITRAGKKYYTFVVGKLNAAKMANFAEIDGWVVIGCWESSLIESTEFWKPIITPFELHLALKPEHERVWTGEWTSDFQHLLDSRTANTDIDTPESDSNDNDDDDNSDSEPPVFDLRTGRYVSHTRPLATRKQITPAPNGSLIKRVTDTALAAQIGGQISPAAQFLRSNRTWQGLGSDHEIAYQIDDDRDGARMQEGRSGLARGYAVGDDESRT